MSREEQIINERLRKLKELKESGVEPYPHNYKRESLASELQKKYVKIKPDSETKDRTKVAGRITNKRDIGKLIFGKIRDMSGEIQIVLKKGDTPEKVFDFFKKYSDVGDFFGIEGKVIKTRTGEISILVGKAEMLSKSILPLPDKWHGLQEKEERYRKRYLDLIMNPEVKEVFEKRQKIINTIRDFLMKRDFIEVETPALQPLYGGAEARPFVTNLYALDNMKLYLSISPEIYLKKLIAGGFERVFTICKNFRNEGIDKWHNPEFTMIELYQTYSDYEDMMKLVEDLLSKLVKDLHGKTSIKYSDKEIDFKTPFSRISMADAVKKYAKKDPSKMTAEQLNEAFEQEVESKLINPTFIIDYPKEICPLTKVHRKNPKLVERFELFINGTELANAYSELNDPIEQKERLLNQIKNRKKANDYDAHFEANIIDEDFISAMSYGLPPLGGVGIGIDRLVMFLTDQPSIRDVILFPFMKPDNSKEEAKK